MTGADPPDDQNDEERAWDGDVIGNSHERSIGNLEMDLWNGTKKNPISKNMRMGVKF
jgi:hypothetical protein